MPLPLPSTVKDPATQQCLDQIANQFPIQAANVANAFLRLATVGNHKASFGEGTLTWTASKIAAAKEIEHGLGVTPAVVFLTSTNSAITFGVESKTASKFKVGGYFEQSVLTGTFAFYWLAIT